MEVKELEPSHSLFNKFLMKQTANKMNEFIRKN